MPQDPSLALEERDSQAYLPLYSLHLDLARGLAAVVVLLGHLMLIVRGHTNGARPAGLPDAMAHPAHASGMGHSAVMVFFVLSGYLVGGSVLRDLKLQRFSWRRYFLRRLSRLWIVLIPAMLLGALLDLATMHYLATTHVVLAGQFTQNFASRYPKPTNFLSHLIFLQLIDRLHVGPFGTNVALWSLSAEFWYYVLFPMFAVALLSKGASTLQRVLLAAGAGSLLWFLGTTISASFILWLLGVAAYLAPRAISDAAVRTVNCGLLVQFFLVLYYVRAHALPTFAGDILLASSFTFLLYGILHRTGKVAPSFYSRLAHTLSFPSYTLYAVHIPMCVLLAALFQARAPSLFAHTYVAAAFILLIVSTYAGLLYYAFERNTQYIFAHVLTPLLASPTSGA